MFKEASPRPSCLGIVHGIFKASHSRTTSTTVREKKSGRPAINTRKTENNPTDEKTDAAGVTSPSSQQLSRRDNLRSSDGGKLTWAQVVATTRKALENAKFAEPSQAMLEEQATATVTAAEAAALPTPLLPTHYGTGAVPPSSFLPFFLLSLALTR